MEGSLEEKLLHAGPLNASTSALDTSLSAKTNDQKEDGSLSNDESKESLPNYELVQHSNTHPKFLHSNSTSHIWPFGAVAELIGLALHSYFYQVLIVICIDNAVDPDVRATEFHIDMVMDSAPKLFFTDNGEILGI